MIFKAIAKHILMKLVDSDLQFEFSNDKSKNSSAFQISIMYDGNCVYFTEFKNRLMYSITLNGRYQNQIELDINDPNLFKNIVKFFKKVQKKNKN